MTQVQGEAGHVRSLAASQAMVVSDAPGVSSEAIAQVELQIDWQLLVSALPTPTFVKNDQQKIVAVSDSFCDFANLDRSQLLGFRNFQLPSNVVLLDADFERAVLETGQPATYKVEFSQPSVSETTELRSIRISLSCLERIGQPQLLLGVVTDISHQASVEQKLASAVRQMKIASEFDGLTGLANRSQLETNISDCLAESERLGETVAIIFINLNGFKSINDGVGHEVGDEVLRVTAHRIREAVPLASVAGRVGGDEFVVLLPATDAKGAKLVAERIAEMIHCPIEIGVGRRELPCSIGISMYPRDGKTCVDLLRKADQAMQLAKSCKPACGLVFYQAAIGEEVERKLMLTRELSAAVRNNELQMYFQPIVRRLNNQELVVGYEALARWHRAETEWVSPDEFIPLLEDTGLIVPAGEQLLSKACKFVAQRSPQQIYVSVNISGKQLLEDGFLEMTERMIRESGIRFDQVAFEITETLAMGDLAAEANVLNSLLALGITLMIDDFGTGYSNLSRLSRLPFRVLKIDRSLLQGVPGKRSETAILGTLIRMTGELNMRMIVEGIETAEQRDHLISLGVDTFQGFLFGKPRPSTLRLL